jgi:hypothetical protein
VARAYTATRVVLVVLDGVRDTEFFENPTHEYIPHIWNDLRHRGYLSHAFYNGGTTLTCSGYSTIASGTRQTLPDDGSRRADRPMLWEYYRDQTGASARSCVTVTEKLKLLMLSYSTSPGYGAADSSYMIGPTWNDSLSVRDWLNYAAQYQPVISCLCLGEIDGGGHSGDWNFYLALIRRADRLVYWLYNGIQGLPGFAGRTAFILTADHGRHDYDWQNHGDGCNGCRHLPFLVIGPDFKVDVEVSSPAADQRDLCNTIGMLLDLPVPLAEGRILTEILRDPSPVDGTARRWTSLRIVPTPADNQVTVRGIPGGAAWGAGDPVLPWSAALLDVQGRRLWSGVISPERLREGWVLDRPPAWSGSGRTWLELRSLDPARPERSVGEIVWIR